MNPVEAYIRELQQIRASGAGVDETSYYGALTTLLNEVGRALRPKVRCIMQLQNSGAGMPDGGLFCAEQFQPASDALPLEGQLPARGALEVKSTGEDIEQTVQSAQVAKYVEHYGLVLVTNYRQFVLVEQSAGGKPVVLERYSLAGSEAEFWVRAAHPRKMAEEHGKGLVEYLTRAMLHAAPLTTARDLAWFLASYAREARLRIERKADLPALAAVRLALEEGLGIRFEGKRGEHFFRSTLVQTLFYGVFSAWVLWHHENPEREEPFDWRLSPYHLHVPVIRALFEQVSLPSKLQPLGLTEVLDWAGAALNRVDRQAFFAAFEESSAVQYFYEPFLQAYDPVLRKQLGVWFTPPEIVQYMVARVDTVLREELGVALGLADPQVYVLDPCCGTGAYLVEVLKRIAATLREANGDALLGDDLKKAATERVFGFEILPAPFVVAHLQLGLLLQGLGAPLSEEKGERVGVYLTNALTNWDMPKPGVQEAKQPYLTGMPELREERDAAEHVKRQAPILVVLGNPPYNAFAGVSPEEEKGLVEPYKEGLISEWGIKKFNLDDLYVRFFRLAERRIAEMTGRGVVCYISNYSYLADPSFVVMRQRFLQEFDCLWFDCLNGDSRETGKRTPDGQPDPSVFSTEYNREGVRLGISIALMARKAQRQTRPTVRFRQYWGVDKRAKLLASLHVARPHAGYEKVHPSADNRYSFRPSTATAEYKAWPTVIDLCADAPISGLQEMRKGALMAVDAGELADRMRRYYDSGVSWDMLGTTLGGLIESTSVFDAPACRKRVQAAEQFDPGNVLRYSLYPMDLRWCYYSAVPGLWNRARPALRAQLWPGNTFIVTRMVAERPNENVPVIATTALPDYHLLRPNGVAIPIRVRATHEPGGRGKARQMAMFGSGEEEAWKANLSRFARAYLEELGVGEPDADAEVAGLIWMHVIAIGYSPGYLSENADGVRGDWLHIPLPARKEALLASAALGRQVAALLDTQRDVTGVTAGALRPELRVIGVITRAGGGTLNPAAGELALTAGWGHAGKGGVVMPGRGRLIERAYTPEELAALQAGAGALGLTLEQALEQLGEATYDVYLNEVAYWKNVPARVWGYVIGGYQVMKKWLSYRERSVLGRALTADEAREVTDMARRIAAILLLQPALDANYRAVKAATYAWPGRGGGARS